MLKAPERGVDKMIVSIRRYLCRDEREREWALEVNRRMAPTVRLASAVLWLAMGASLPWIPFVSILPLVPLTLMWMALELVPPRARRPEYLLLGTLASTAFVAGSLVLMHGQRSPAIAVMFVGIIAAGTGFPTRLMIPLVAVHTCVVVAIIVTFPAAPLAIEPSALLVIAAFAGVVIMMTAGRRVSADLRDAAVLDPLTGLLNRGALASRSHELSELSARDGSAVALVVADIDNFKRINDTYGHARGDAVLVDVATRLRTSLRAFDNVYRIGGEEFAFLLPGASSAAAEAVAELLRDAISREPLAGGLTVTASFGVSVSSEETPFAFAEQFSRADAALYSAKQSGRNRVVVAAGACAFDASSDRLLGSRAPRVPGSLPGASASTR